LLQEAIDTFSDGHVAAVPRHMHLSCARAALEVDAVDDLTLTALSDDFARCR